MSQAKGRPTLYKAEYANQVYKFALLGATLEQIADFFDVSLKTVSNWMNEHEEFLHAIKKGREIADAEVAHALYNRAKGYVTTEQRIVTDGQGGYHVVEVEKEIIPDTAASFIWLKNRQPEKWRDKPKDEANDDISKLGEAIVSFLDRK